MMPKQVRDRRGPEKKIQDDLEKFLRMREWFVKSTVGNMYQSGFPDIYATHRKYGIRWIEVKLPNMVGSQWTPAQLEDFPLLRANGTRIWVLTAATEEEYQKLFKQDNLWQYMGGFAH